MRRARQADPRWGAAVNGREPRPYSLRSAGAAQGAHGMQQRCLETCRKPVVAGIDEAGRGPIVGPMVMAMVVLPVDELRGLRLQGVRDSKQLTPRQREQLLSLVEEHAPFVIWALHPPRLIDSVNLNRLEYDTASYMVERVLLRCCEVRAIYADAVGPPERYAAALRRVAPGVRIVVVPKADSRYTAVAAASIVAKVVRDAYIEKYRREYGLRGSGYPTDEETLQWIREIYARNPAQPPPIVRRTWGTLRRIAPGWYREKNLKKPSRMQGRTLLDYLSRHTSEQKQ